jgi:LysM repeat protein
VQRSRFAHWAAPVAFLAAISIGALFVRAGLEQGPHHHTNTPTTTVTSKTKKKHRHAHAHPRRRTYVIQHGDTLGGIAARYGTTITRLMQLNPGIDPNALHVGQSIRVQ